MGFLRKSIKAKITALIVLILSLSQIASFIVTYQNIRLGEDRNIEDSFERTQELLETLIYNKKSKLVNQAKLVGQLPIMVAVLDSGDENTIIDSGKAYKDDLELSFVSVFDSYGEFLANTDNMGMQFGSELGQDLLSSVVENEVATSFAVRDDELVLVAASSVGAAASPSGFLIFGEIIDDSFAKTIKELTNSDVKFIINDSLVASSYESNEKRIDDYISKSIPLEDYKGQVIGSLVLEASLEKSQMFFQSLIIVIVLLSVAVFIIFLLVGLRFSRNITSPIIALKDAATRISENLDYTIRAPEVGQDEIAGLSKSFNTLLNEIERNHRELEDYSKNLEEKVEERTVELKESNDKMEDLLNNLDEGFMVFDESGKFQEGSTKAVQRFFGIDPEGKEIHEIFHIKDEQRIADLRNWKNLLFSDVKIDIVSLLDVGPKSFITSDEKYIGVDYKAIFSEDKRLEKVICVSADKTKEMRFKEEAEKEKATVKLVISVLDDRGAFVDFVIECQKIIKGILDHLKEEELSIDFLFRYMHTIKGGSSSYNFIDVAKEAHSLENLLTDLKAVSPEELEKKRNYLLERTELIEQKFSETLEKHKELIGPIGGSENKEITVSEDEMKRIYSLVKTEVGEGSPILEELEKNFFLENMGDSFVRYEKVVNRVAESQGKKVNLKIHHEKSIFVNPLPYKGLIASFVHIFRNAVDHGIEDCMTREMIEKPMSGTIEVDFKVGNGGSDLFILVSDDGQGIDGEKIGRLAVDKEVVTQEKLEKMKLEEKVQLIFSPGFSSKDEVSDISGRGVGLDSVMFEAKKLGGYAVVKTVPESGSQFIIKIPYFGADSLS